MNFFLFSRAVAFEELRMYLDVAKHAILHTSYCPLAERNANPLLFLGKTSKFYKSMFLSIPARGWVDGVELLLCWGSGFCGAGGCGGLCLGGCRRWCGGVPSHRGRLPMCGAVGLSQAFLLCSDAGVRGRFRRIT